MQADTARLSGASSVRRGASIPPSAFRESFLYKRGIKTLKQSHSLLPAALLLLLAADTVAECSGEERQERGRETGRREEEGGGS